MIGYINGYDERSKTLSVIVPNFEDIDFLTRKEATECEVTLKDGRLITPKQRTAILLTCRDIAEFLSGYSKKQSVLTETLSMLQLNYLLATADDDSFRYALTEKYCYLNGVDFFSLSPRNENCASVDLAHDFLSWMIDLCIENAIPCSTSLLDRAEDIQRYLYSCVANRRCSICGKKADIHHSHDRVGTGRDRKTIVHEGMEVQPLCRVHHTEAHTIGQLTFDEKYHIQGIKLDKHLCEKIGLRAKAC